MELSDNLKKAITLLYSSGNYSDKDYEQRYIQAVKILKKESQKGDANAIYFLSRTYFGDQYIPNVSVGEKYENSQLGYQFLRQSFDQRSPFAIINGALRVPCGISDEAIRNLIAEEPKAFSQAIAQIEEWADNGNYFANYILASFFYWGDNQLFGDTNHRDDLALKYYSKAQKNGMIVDNFAYNILDIVVNLENETELTRWYKIIANSGYPDKTIVSMLDIANNPWAHAMVYLYGFGRDIDVSKAYKICKRNKIRSLLTNFIKTGFFSSPIYNYPQT